MSKNGRTGPEAELEAARDKARWILENHRPDPLDELAQVEIGRVLAAADHEIKGS
jgi:hypothetical protein